MIASLLYIGAGTDVQVVKYFPQVEKFVFIDTQPRSEFDSVNSYEHLFYRKRFCPELISNLETNGFILKKVTTLNNYYYKSIFNFKQMIYFKFIKFRLPEYINPTVLLFQNHHTNQIIKYYVSTNILTNMCKELEKDIRESDGLIVSGYHPNDILFQYMDIPKKFFGSTTTYFGHDRDDGESNTIIEKLYTNPQYFSKYFSEYHLIDFENCRSIGEYKNIQDLYQNSCLIKLKEPDDFSN